MKFSFSLLALAMISTAQAADYSSCRNDLNGVADAYTAYMSKQSASCIEEMNKPGATRSRLSILAKCSNAIGELQPIKDRSGTACSQCKGVDAKIAEACQDDGVQTFINRVKAL